MEIFCSGVMMGGIYHPSSGYKCVDRSPGVRNLGLGHVNL